MVLFDIAALIISTDPYVQCIRKYVVHENVVGGSSMIWFPIADCERDSTIIEPGPLGWVLSNV